MKLQQQGTHIQANQRVYIGGRSRWCLLSPPPFQKMDQWKPYFQYIGKKTSASTTVLQATLVEAVDMSRSLLFYNNDLLVNIKNTMEIHIDGTFKSRPRVPEVYQLLTFIAMKSDEVIYGAKFVKCTHLKTFFSDFLESPRNYCPSEPLLTPLRERLQYDGLSVYRGSNFQPFTAHADTQLTITSTKVIQINFFMAVLEIFFHQLYAEGNGFRLKKLFELHFLILNIFLSFSPSVAVNFLSKIMFKKKLDFFPLK